jgi:branched-chain amino acid transport system permease protein
MMEILPGLVAYGVFFLTLAGIYAVVVLGLNVQWGYAEMLNFGVGAFFAVGAYTSAILTTPSASDHLGGFGLPFLAGCAAAMVLSGILALGVGIVTVGLRSDYLAIATIGIAEILRLVITNEDWLTNGVRGIGGIPRPLSGWVAGGDQVLYMAIVLLAVVMIYVAIERAYRAPWGRVLRAIRDNEPAVLAAGKGVVSFRLQAFVLGSAIMGLGGALYAHFVMFISPEAFRPEFATFLVWVMLIVGGSGNNKGAILGAFVIWAIWSATEILVSQFPPEWATRAGALRVLSIGILLEIVILARAKGLLPEKPPRLSGSEQSESVSKTR